MRLLDITNALDVAEETLENANALGGAMSLERWAYAGRMTLIGMVMVFAVLATLWGVLVIFEKVMNKGASKKEKTIETAPVVAPVVEEIPVAAASAEDEVIAAVIAAAVAAYLSDGGCEEAVYNGGFRVVSFRRVQGGKAWNSKH